MFRPIIYVLSALGLMASPAVQKPTITLRRSVPVPDYKMARVYYSQLKRRKLNRAKLR